VLQYLECMQPSLFYLPASPRNPNYWGTFVKQFRYGIEKFGIIVVYLNFSYKSKVSKMYITFSYPTFEYNAFSSFPFFLSSKFNPAGSSSKYQADRRLVKTCGFTDLINKIPFI